MIVKEDLILDDGRQFVKTYSDTCFKIRKVGTDEKDEVEETEEAHQ